MLTYNGKFTTFYPLSLSSDVRRYFADLIRHSKSIEIPHIKPDSLLVIKADYLNVPYILFCRPVQQSAHSAILHPMETPLFDTRHAADTLIAGGIQQDHANAIVTMLDECLHGTVAKTSDLNEVKAELKADIAEVKAELKTDIAEVKAELKADIAEVKADIAEVKTELKADIAEVKTELKADIAEVKTELKADIAEDKAELTTMRSDLETRIVQQANKTILAVIAAAGVIVAVIKLF